MRPLALLRLWRQLAPGHHEVRATRFCVREMGRQAQGSTQDLGRPQVARAHNPQKPYKIRLFRQKPPKNPEKSNDSFKNPVLPYKIKVFRLRRRHTSLEYTRKLINFPFGRHQNSTKFDPQTDTHTQFDQFFPSTNLTP